MNESIRKRVRGTAAKAGAVIDLRDRVHAHLPTLPPMPHLYASAQATWRGRMINEYSSAAVFEGLAGQVEEAGLAPKLAQTCLGFAAEERHHGVLCAAVLEALGGEALADEREQHVYPKHVDIGPREALLRNLLSISCTSETVAVALIGAERLEMPEGPLRELLTRIYADEVGHARFGWRLVGQLVPRLDEAAKRRLSAYLAVCLAHLEEHELTHIPADVKPPPEAAALGMCNGNDARRLFYDTVAQVILPGLEAVGLDAQRAWELRHEAQAFVA